MLATWYESYDKPKQYIKKKRHQFTDKFCMVKTMVFPGVVYRCENWTIKKAKHQGIDAMLEKTREPLVL